MIKNKKGAELSLNVIIISIIVIVVLVVVIAVFLKGINVFQLGTDAATPDRISSFTNSCSSNCQLAQNFDTRVSKEASAYCRETIKIDTNNDGIADIKAHCNSQYINVECPSIQCKTPPEEPLV